MMKISTTQYAKTLLELTENKSQEEILTVTAKFASQLKADGQLKNAAKIMERYAELYNAAHGIISTQVCGRQQMSTDVLDKVKEFVKQKYAAKEVEMSVTVDEKIQGGIIIKVGDEIVDGSIQKTLTNLKKILSS